MLMSSLQFAAQILMAKFVLYLGVVERKHPEKLSWHQYFMQGGSPAILLPHRSIMSQYVACTDAFSLCSATAVILSKLPERSSP